MKLVHCQNYVVIYGQYTIESAILSSVSTSETNVRGKNYAS